MRFTYDWDLQMFGEGGDGAGAAPGDAPAAEGQTGVTATDAGEAAVNNRRQNRRQQSLNVDYGKAPDMLSNNSNSSEKRDLWQKEQTPENTKADGPNGEPAAKEETFEELIKGKYKEDYDRRVQDTISRRFKTADRDKKTLESLEPVLQKLAAKYEVDMSDINDDTLKQLIDAVEEDDTYYEDEAERLGITVRALKSKKKLEAENARFKQIEAQRQKEAAERAREEQMQRSFSAVRQQGDQLKTEYPDFDLSTEMRDERFMRLITNNVDVRTAYEVCHRDRFLKQAAQKAAQQVSDSVQANAARPTENGVQAPAAPARTRVTDPRNLTPQMRKDLRNRVRRGEKIYW